MYRFEVETKAKYRTVRSTTVRERINHIESWEGSQENGWQGKASKGHKNADNANKVSSREQA